MKTEFLIIDGYNLLHTRGTTARGGGPGSLERSRNALIGILKQHLPEAQRRRTTIVFDSAEPDLPTLDTREEMLIEFASDHESADERIVQLIRRHSAPKQLLVVSSDHEIQRAARARRARTIDSDQWLDRLLESAAAHARTGDPSTRLPEPDETGSGPIDVDYWMEIMELDRDQPHDRKPDPPQKTERGPGPSPLHDDSAIFPPGFADDLPDDDQDVV